jgi:hypothetical protein
MFPYLSYSSILGKGGLECLCQNEHVPEYNEEVQRILFDREFETIRDARRISFIFFAAVCK